MYPVNQPETLSRHYGFTGNINEDAAVNVPGQRDPVDAIIGTTPGDGRGVFDFKIVDTQSNLPFAVMMPGKSACQGIALHKAAMDWSHSNDKNLRPDPVGLPAPVRGHAGEYDAQRNQSAPGAGLYSVRRPAR